MIGYILLLVGAVCVAISYCCVAVSCPKSEKWREDLEQADYLRQHHS